MAIAPEDIEMIAHIEFICGNIHDFGNELYEDLMDRDHEEVKVKAKELIEVLDDLIQSLTEDI
jgi:hypothetical protein